MRPPHDEFKREFRAEQHSDGAIAGVSVAMIVVALTSLALAF